MNKKIASEIAIGIILLVAIIYGAFIYFGDENTKRENPDTPNAFPIVVNSSNEMKEYVACGCGCCKGEEPRKECLYRSKGDDIQKIIEEDKQSARSSSCNYAGCASGIKYTYCD